MTPGNPLKLILASEVTLPADYATLSHCWGSHLPLRLLTSNLSAFRREIPFNKLSKTFQHSITIARHMKVPYLWIDSLCIIQDSPSDWLGESATMASVYSNSCFNISAAHAPNGDAGCFTTRDPTVLVPLQLNVPWAGMGTSAGLHFVLEKDWWQRHVNTSPLFRRAWVFQEQVLSKRNLIFGDVEVLFVCREMVASEQFPSGIPTGMDGPELREAGKWMKEPVRNHAPSWASDQDGPGKNDLNDSQSVLDLWHTLVAEFAQGILTFESDKLIAFSAIAMRMSQHTRSEYLAGLWRKYLPGQLLWFSYTQDTNLQPRPSEYVAPSWSWASTSGRVATWFIYRPEFEKVLDIVDVQVVPLDANNLFGGVKSAILTVTGYLAKADQLCHGENCFGSKDEASGSNLCFDVYWDCKKKLGHADTDTYYLLPVLADYNTEDMVGGPGLLSSVHGLVLQRISSAKNEYRREGRFDVVRWKRVGFQAACRNLAAELGLGEVTDGWGANHLLNIV